jgi:heavy metal translocating P-type ATPase
MSAHEDGVQHIDRADLIRIMVMVAAITAFWLLPHLSTAMRLAGLLAAAIGGYPILHEAASAVKERRMTMELSMAIAVTAALVIGEIMTALVIILFVLIAELIEARTVGQGRRAIKELLDTLPREALVRRGGETREIAAVELGRGDIVIVRPGSQIPVDGVVVQGNSFADESMITGESVPAEKAAGSRVYAGTVNQSGALEVETVTVGADTAYGRIIRAVEEAEKSRAPIQRTADRLAGYLVYFAISCAILTYVVTRDPRATISVIIVTGACGVAAGTPLAILGAIGQAARKGAIIKGGRYLELMAAVDTVVLDKTGTLTLGDARVIGIRPASGATADSVLEAAAIGERLSEHPLGKAILRKAAERSLPIIEPERFSYVPGKGITCAVGGEEIAVGNRTLLMDRGLELNGFIPAADHSTEVLVARAGRLLGSLQIADVLRPEAKEAVRALHEMGIRTALLTGDTKRVADAIAVEIGIDQVEAELLPDQKLERIRALMTEGRIVAMVGDGVNDAPALMQANVGVAMGSGTHVAQESADVLLLGNDLMRLADSLRLARQCHRIIMTNFVGTLIVDCVGVGLAALGFINPMVAAFIHVTSELAFILNSARLLPRRAERE